MGYTINNAVVEGASGAAQYSSRITLAHAYILTAHDLKFTIEWRDDSNHDGTRPGAVNLVLYYTDSSGQLKEVTRESVSAAMCETSSDGNTWTYTFEDMQKYVDGEEIVYTIAVVLLV